MEGLDAVLHVEEAVMCAFGSEESRLRRGDQALNHRCKAKREHFFDQFCNRLMKFLLEAQVDDVFYIVY